MDLKPASITNKQESSNRIEVKRKPDTASGSILIWINRKGILARFLLARSGNNLPRHSRHGKTANKKLNAETHSIRFNWQEEGACSLNQTKAQSFDRALPNKIDQRRRERGKERDLLQGILAPIICNLSKTVRIRIYLRRFIVITERSTLRKFWRRRYVSFSPWRNEQEARELQWKNFS